MRLENPQSTYIVRNGMDQADYVPGYGGFTGLKASASSQLSLLWWIASKGQMTSVPAGMTCSPKRMSFFVRRVTPVDATGLILIDSYSMTDHSQVLGNIENILSKQQFTVGEDISNGNLGLVTQWILTSQTWWRDSGSLSGLSGFMIILPSGQDLALHTERK